MKMTIKYITALLTVSALLTSCAKEPALEQSDSLPQEEGTRTIAVSFAPQPATKTALGGEDGLTPEFVDGEMVLVSNDETTQKCPVTGSGKKATITTRLQGDLTAVYPVSAAKLIKSEITGYDIIDPDNVNILPKQSGTFAEANICMTTMKDGEAKMTFHNKTAILKFYVDKSINVERITVNGKNIAGEKDYVEVYDDQKRLLYETTDDPNKRICYVAVSPGVSASSLTFSAVTRTQETVTRTSSAKNVTLEAGKMYNAFIPYYIEVNVGTEAEPEIQHWAYCNLGAFLPEEPGYYFSWGNTTGYVHNGEHWEIAPGYSGAGTELSGGFTDSNYDATPGKALTGDIPTESAYDAAVAAWGEKWRMPTAEEFVALARHSYAETRNNDLYIWKAKGEDAGYAKINGTLKKIGDADMYLDDDSHEPNAYNPSTDSYLFFPTSGHGYLDNLCNPTENVNLRSRSLRNFNSESFAFCVSPGGISPNLGQSRWIGYPIRPIYGDIAKDISDLKINPYGQGTNLY